MPRLDIKRQNEQEPKRLEYAKSEIEKLGYKVEEKAGKTLTFEFKKNTVVLFVYSGWHTGKSIVDGRGIKKLLNQIKK